MTIEKIQDGLYRYLFKKHRLRGSELDDTVQDCWLKILKHGYVRKANHWGYYRAIAYTVFIDNIRAASCQKRGKQFIHVPLHIHADGEVSDVNREM